MESEVHLELKNSIDTLIIRHGKRINTIKMDEANLHRFKMKLRFKDLRDIVCMYTLLCNYKTVYNYVHTSTGKVLLVI